MMEWIDAVRPSLAGWAFDVVGTTGIHTQCDTRELPNLARRMKGEGGSRRKALVNLSLGQAVTAQEYFDGLSPGIAVSTNHEVYAFEYEGTRYLVPAIVLMGAFFRPFAPDIIKLFYLPQGLDLLCAPDLASEKPSVNIFEGMWPAGYREIDSHLAALSWMHCFPSARAFAASPFEKALRGRIGVSLPNATATMVLHGIPRGDTFLVTGASVSSLQADEEPYEFASMHPRTVVLHEGREPVIEGGKVQTAVSLCLRERGNPRLTDAEWEVVEPLVRGTKRSRRCSLRDVLDCVIAKLATGVPWREASTDAVTWNNAQQHYREWQRTGVWQSLLAVLAANRAPVPA